jgi:hypothetical protein
VRRRSSSRFHPSPTDTSTLPTASNQQNAWPCAQFRLQSDFRRATRNQETPKRDAHIALQVIVFLSCPSVASGRVSAPSPILWTRPIAIVDGSDRRRWGFRGRWFSAVWPWIGDADRLESARPTAFVTSALGTVSAYRTAKSPWRSHGHGLRQRRVTWPVGVSCWGVSSAVGVRHVGFGRRQRVPDREVILAIARHRLRQRRVTWPVGVSQRGSLSEIPVKSAAPAASPRSSGALRTPRGGPDDCL